MLLSVLFIVLILTLPFSLFLLILVAGSLKTRPLLKTVQPKQRRLTILIPAHNEEAVIAETVTSALACAALGRSAEVLVVADNCTDATADIAENCGARVILRTHGVERGKGFALSYGLHYLLSQPEVSQDDVILVLDSDSVLGRNVGDACILAADRGAEFFQLYDTVKNAGENWRTGLLLYAFALFNGVWLKGSDRLGLGSHLRGNGMGFVVSGLRRRPWQASSLAEDLEFSWKLRIANEHVHFIEDAAVYAIMPTGGKESQSQRQRWESGRRALKNEFTTQILVATIPSWKKILFLLDIWMPALSTLVLTVGLALVVALWQWRSNPNDGTHDLALGFAANATCIFVYLASPFFVMKLNPRYLFVLAMAPYYAIWRIIMVLRKSPAHWIRTARKQQK